MNLMGGHIWIESDGVGHGSTVTFVVRLGTSNEAGIVVDYDRNDAGVTVSVTRYETTSLI